MNDNFVPYLCGGIFFSFLIELHNDTATEFKDVWKTNKAITHSKIMENLIQAIKPGYRGYGNQDSLKKTVSEYHACKSDGGRIIPFERESIRTGFDRSVKEQYGEVLGRMKEFADKSFTTYNDRSAIRLLIERTLTLIRDDISIEDDALFFINEDGSPISKKEISEIEVFNFYSFLVGIWHYIIAKPTKNKNGKETFGRLFPKNDGKERTIDIRCLKPYTHDIIVTGLKISEESSSEEIYEYKDTSKSTKTGKNEKLAVKIYYKGSLLQDEEEKAILSSSPSIIDLNEHPDISIKDNPGSTIYKITTEFQIKTQPLSPEENIIRFYCTTGSSSISGTTSIENWNSRSKLNEMRFQKKYPCTAWFTLVPCSEYEYSAEFLLIGSIMQ